MCLFIFSFLNPLYLLLHQDEEMNALDQLRENKQKRGKFEETMRRERKKEKKKSYKELKKKFLEQLKQFILNRLHQG
jgi:hypothetical protein